MMDNLLKFSIDETLKQGADHAECTLTKRIKWELNVSGKEITLLRTTDGRQLTIKAIKDQKKGSVSTDKLNEEHIKQVISNLISNCESSKTDDCYAISPMEKANFIGNAIEPDKEGMYNLLVNYLQEVKEKYPLILMEPCIWTHISEEKQYANSNGAEFNSIDGTYEFEAAMTAVDGNNTSSFNFTGFLRNNLDQGILECGSLDTILKELQGQIHTQSLGDKFEGTIILTPDVLQSIMWMYVNNFLSDGNLISGTSPFKDKLNKQVASKSLTFMSNPLDPELSYGYHITKDGFIAENQTIIENGILKSYLLTLEGSNKTKLPRGKNHGDAFNIKEGQQSIDDLIKSTDRGILLGRFSGGRPSSNGDFSGVAKNSYYIENGEIKYPLSEVMISGNLIEMFKNIDAISKERINFGNALMPWISCSGITISG